MSSINAFFSLIRAFSRCSVLFLTVQPLKQLFESLLISLQQYMIHLPLLKSPTPPLNLPLLPGKPLTPCQQQQVDFFGTPPSAGKYLPRCSSSGEYIEIQCSLQGDECWCVTEEGREVPQTRSRGPLRCPKPGLKNMVLSLFHILYHLSYACTKMSRFGGHCREASRVECRATEPIGGKWQVHISWS